MRPRQADPKGSVGFPGQSQYLQFGHLLPEPGLGPFPVFPAALGFLQLRFQALEFPAQLLMLLPQLPQPRFQNLPRLLRRLPR